MGQFVPGDRNIVTTSFDQTVRLWDIESERELRQYTQHTAPIFCMSISADGSTLVTGAQDNTVRVWDLPHSAPLRTILGENRSARQIALSPQNQHLLFSPTAMGVTATDLSNEELKVPRELPSGGTISAVAYRGDGAFYATGDSEGNVVIWNPFVDEPQALIHAHRGAVNDIAFTSNNQQLVTSGDDGMIRLWQLLPERPQEFSLANHKIKHWSAIPDQSQAFCITDSARAFQLNLNTGEVAVEYPKLDSLANQISVASNRTWIAIADDRGQVHLLNADGSPRAIKQVHARAVVGVAIHPDSTRFATSGMDGKVMLWGQPVADNPEMEPLQSFLTGDDQPVVIHSLVFAPDQQHLFGGGEDGQIYQWNLSTGEKIAVWDAHSSGSATKIRKIMISPNNQLLLSIGEDQTLRTFSMADRTALQTMEHSATANDFSITTDSQRAVVACEDGSLVLWDLVSGLQLESFIIESASATAVCFSPDNQRIFSSSTSQTLKHFKPSVLRAFQVHANACQEMVLYSGGSQALTSDADQVLMTNLSNGELVRPYRIRDKEIDNANPSDSDQADSPGDTQPVVVYESYKPTAIVTRVDNQRVAAGTESGEVIVWNANDGENPLFRLLVEGEPKALAYSSDNQRLAVSTDAKRVYLFGPSLPGVNPAVELTLHQVIELDSEIMDLHWSSDGTSIFTLLESGSVQEWRYAGLAQRRQMNHGGAVFGVVVSQDGKWCVSCSADQSVRIWNTQSGQQKADMRGHVGPVLAIAVSADETFAVTAGADQTLRLWDLVGGRQLKLLARFDEAMYAVAIHPQGALVAAAGADRKVHLLDLITGEIKRTIEGHPDYVHCVQFDLTGNRLLSYGYAGHLMVWDVNSGNPIHQSRIGKVGNYAGISTDNRSIVLSNGDSTARVIPFPQ